MMIPRRAIAAGCIVLVLAACSDREPSSPGGDPLAGLTVATRGDTAPAPPPSTPRGAGYFVGTVYGYVPGGDTLANAVRLEGARVTAFVRVDTGEGVTAGRQVATVPTDARGWFQLPTLPGGEYVVTFVPAAPSPYRGGWTTAESWHQSGDSPWHIMLPPK